MSRLCCDSAQAMPARRSARNACRLSGGMAHPPGVTRGTELRAYPFAMLMDACAQRYLLRYAANHEHEAAALAIMRRGQDQTAIHRTRLRHCRAWKVNAVKAFPHCECVDAVHKDLHLGID